MNNSRSRPQTINYIGNGLYSTISQGQVHQKMQLVFVQLKSKSPLFLVLGVPRYVLLDSPLCGPAACSRGERSSKKKAGKIASSSSLPLFAVVYSFLFLRSNECKFFSKKIVLLLQPTSRIIATLLTAIYQFYFFGF